MSVDGVEFHNRIARVWTEGYSKGSFRRRLTCLDTILRPNVRQGDHWLDAGCGSGVLARRILDLGAEVDGVDASAAMIDAAKKETRKPTKGIRFHVTRSIEELDFKDEAFDGILCSSVIEYVKDPDSVFSEFSRLLKPSGTLILSVPNRYSIMRMIQKAYKKIMSKMGIETFAYLSVSLHEFSKDEIQKTLKTAGLELVEVKSFDPFFSLLGCATGIDSLLIFVAKRRASGDKNEN